MHVAIHEITKVFGKLRANDAVTMELSGGNIYAVLGENGAGKSTLMKILSGFQPADSGQILLDGRPVTFETPADALAVGIGMLHQDPLDVPSLTVIENFMLSAADKTLMPDRRKALVELQNYSEQLGFSLRPDVYVDTLTIGERQQLEIVRLLSRGAKLLILDEPTTGISAAQKDALFGALRRLAHEEHFTVCLVSHKLEDVEALCDQVYVLRQGKVVGSADLPCPTDELVHMMFGKSLERSHKEPYRRLDEKRTTLKVTDLSVTGRRVSLKDVNFEVEAGQVIGLAGLDGSGQEAFLRACAGLQQPTKGELFLNGQNITRWDYHRRMQCGISYAPAGRLEEGLVGGLTLAEHFALVGQHGGWVNWKGATERAVRSISHYNIKGRPDSEIQMLSGGNQQRTLLSLLPADLKLLLLENPTRGLDVESARWVWSQLLDRRTQGTAIVFTSPDLDEIMEYSDQIVVFFNGRETLVDDPAKVTPAQLGHLIGGKAL
jgi:simple sugar transport system ATP-binding protein